MSVTLSRTGLDLHTVVVTFSKQFDRSNLRFLCYVVLLEFPELLQTDVASVKLARTHQSEPIEL